MLKRRYSDLGNCRFSGVSWRPLLIYALAIYQRVNTAKNMEVPSAMKKLWLASPLLLASLCLAAQTGSSSSSTSGTQGQSATQPSTQSSTSATDQNSNSSSTSATAPSSTDQSSTSATSSSDPNATAGQTATSGRKSKNGKLPQTASPLPLLGLLGLGSLGAGLFRFRKR